MMMMLIESSDDDVADRNDVVDRAVKVLLLLKFEDEDYMLKMTKSFQRLIDVSP